MFTLQIKENGTVTSTTQHSTVTEALREFEGWKNPDAQYVIDGTCTVDYACKRVQESRNRVLHLALSMSYQQSADEEIGFSCPMPIELKAPQICKLLTSMLDDNALVRLQVTNTEICVY